VRATEICLCIIFNHNYEANLPRLRQIYSSRFSKIIFLMPFYRGAETDVLSYSANSFYFQSSVAQNVKELHAVNAKHYVFIADDLILNPSITEQNVIAALQVGIDEISLPAVANLVSEWGSSWERRFDIAQIHDNAMGVEWQNLLPTYSEMVARITNIGMDYRVDISHFCDRFIRLGHMLPDTRPLIVEPPYPCLAAYSDIFVIPKALLGEFAHYAGVTSAMKLFAEVAIPTVALMASETLGVIPCQFVSEPTNMDLGGKGIAYWDTAIENFSAACEMKLANAFTAERSESLFIHPIKLSKWS
jgi:hypothetical protein